MPSAKEILSSELCSWLNGYLSEKYSKEYNVEVLIPKGYLSKLPNKSMKQIPNFSSFEFKPDVLGILTSKNQPTNVKLVFVNRSVNALSLKEIGEILCYARIAKPIEAFLVSPKALANEVNLILLDSTKQQKVLKFGDSKMLCIGKYADENVAVIFPR